MAELRAPKPKDTTTTLTCSSTVTEVVFRADVSAQGGGAAPTGTVTFRDSTTVIQTVDINGSFTSTTTPDSVTATYNGDSKYSKSISQTLRPPY